MTTTKFISLIGAVMPFGILLLTALALYKLVQTRRASSP